MTIKRIDPERAKELLDADQGFVYLDVRTEGEFKEEHVPDSKNLPVMVPGPGGAGIQMNAGFVEVALKHFQMDEKIILGCRRGGRSNKAAQLLAANGFTNIYDMKGGIGGETDPFGKTIFAGWSSRGLPTTAEYQSGDLLL